MRRISSFEKKLIETYFLVLSISEQQVRRNSDYTANNSFSYFLLSFQNFREQCIDGSGLPLLTEDHLMHSLNMKLGPALKLRSVLLKKLGGPCPCVSCCSSTGNINNCSATVSSVPSPLNRPSSTGSGT